MRQTALLTGVAGLLLMTAPAIAQDGTAPQTPPPPAAPAGQATQAPTLTLQPGMTVRGGDGDLGVLVGARTNAGRQQLTVRGADGTLRAVPIDGIRQEGEVVVVDFTVEQFGSAETVAEPAQPGMIPPPPSTPEAPGIPAPPPAVPANPVDDANPPPMEHPVSPPPTLPPENPAEPEAPPAPTAATPVPGEAADQEPDGS